MNPMCTNFALGLLAASVLAFAVPVHAAPPSSHPGPGARAVTLSAAQRQVVDELLAAQHPYACCSESLAVCLEQSPVCPLALRLQRSIIRMTAAGLSKPQIEAALAHRQASMTSERPPAKVTVDERFRAGKPDAGVALVLYACPRSEACSKLIPDLHREVTAGRLKDKAALHYRPFFPAGNEESFECGRGLYAAAYQGKFWPYLLHLCTERPQLSRAQLRDWVGSHGLDRCIFDHTCEQPGAATWLATSRAEGAANGVTTAPAVFVNGRRILGPLDLETLVDLVEEEHERVTTAQAGAGGASESPKPAAKKAAQREPTRGARPGGSR